MFQSSDREAAVVSVFAFLVNIGHHPSSKAAALKYRLKRIIQLLVFMTQSRTLVLIRLASIFHLIFFFIVNSPKEVSKQELFEPRCYRLSKQ